MEGNAINLTELQIELRGIEEHKFDKLMGDDKILVEEKASPERLTPEERESKFGKLFDVGDFFKKSVHGEVERNTEPEIQRAAAE